MTAKNVISSRPGFVALTIAIILALFLAGHDGLVMIYRMGTAATQVSAIVLSAAVAALFVWRQDHRLFPLLAGTALWAVLGEIAEHLGYLTIVDIKAVFVLPVLLAVFVYLINKRYLSFFWAVSFGLFFGVWASHFVMVNMFEAFGKQSGPTYGSSLLFAGLLVFSLYRMNRTNTRLGLTVLSIIFTCSCWSILEYFWAWKVIPKPW
jgi:hypothetical protein